MTNDHRNTDFSSDEIRRQLRSVDRMNTSAMPQWRSALGRLFGDESISTEQRAVALGVPSPTRRDLFRMGGASILGAALLAACGDDDKSATTTAAPGDTVTPSDTPTTVPVNMDLVLAKTAASLEKLAVDAYGIAAGLITTPAILQAATMFAGHHQLHLDALNGVITGAGSTAVTEMNQAVFDALVKPALDAATTEADAVTIALTLEEAAAQTYVYAGGALSTPALRSTIMTIGGVEARHAAVLRMAALAQSPLDVFPDGRGFFPGDNPLAGIDGALITA
ncbi:MAG: ferritin-like domain-containing protein [Actinobacteria bacterium]|nr:ferritin-like domain-containing protein [Actinomycetota bacterium]